MVSVHPKVGPHVSSQLSEVIMCLSAVDLICSFCMALEVRDGWDLPGSRHFSRLGLPYPPIYEGEGLPGIDVGHALGYHL